MSGYRGHDYRSRVQAIALLGKKCQVCGSEKNVFRHHLDGNPKNDNPVNWRMLCCSCHRKVHSKYHDTPPEVIKKIKNLIAIKSRLKKINIHLRKYAGYIKTSEACRILGVSRQSISIHAADWFLGIRYRKLYKHGGRGIWMFPRDHIVAISGSINKKRKEAIASRVPVSKLLDK